ncbi:hypothetical protein KAFR_0F02220 [Kazachstania africana CBS 2517]|uniref:Protein kinase domain-containing protein n=1 Tax=Kazachstania africana (strain ATCC 22294 / BCRC 22015 / CBS 2517 / CECT 1963 / NBRC 1671 / NRRL Y-8276) TaxID=1071382 RepID=H2AWR9_KAZAF|nr:hypothetical protein KAFR_0F02220 [Kazachstania africana CBS 2517]CCF58819.1 hypothetical protein KAFR_0F02220 [Kazachstania africana CBS 2517]
MSKYTHPSRSRLQRQHQNLSSISNDSDDDENIIGPPKLSNFGSALLTENDNSGTTSRFHTQFRSLNGNSVHSPISLSRNNSYGSYGIAEQSPQTSIFATTINNRPISMTTIQNGSADSNVTNNVNDKYESSYNKINKIQQSIKDELTSRHTGRIKRFLNTNRMNKLGPAKRASTMEVDIPLPANTNDSYNSSSDVFSGQAIEEANDIKEVQNYDYSNINFGDLNPFQFLRKYNLPTTELPNISKIYFERQKEENRLSILKKHTNNNTGAKTNGNDIKDFSISKNLTSEDKTDLKNTVNTGLVSRTLLNSTLSSRKTNSSLSPKSKDNNEFNSLDVEEPKHLTSNNDEIRPNKRREPLVDLSTNRKEPELKRFKTFEENKKRDEIINEKENVVQDVPKSMKRVEIMEPKMSHRQRNVINVNETEYEKIELLGRGGSSKVYKVKGPSNKVFALKRVVFDEFDDSSINGFKGEIKLLNKLRNENRVVKLFDYEMNQGLLYLIMECGDVDLSQILNQKINLNLPFDIEFIRYYTREMIKCVKVVHDNGIVHSDLKPANFVLVKGVLKIIDFGIADAVPDHTVNIYRETQTGTPNYMAPETLIAMNYTNNGAKDLKWKVGKPSDVWSCGCIIYQMIYGKAPYAGFQGQHRIFAIMNSDVKIVYPEKTNEEELIPKTMVELMKNCLRRDPGKRWTVDDILSSTFLNPIVTSQSFIRDLIKNAITFGSQQKIVSEDKINDLTNDVLTRLQEFKM